MKKQTAIIFVFILILSIIQHLPSFKTKNFYGDQYVYIYLSQVMNWDLSNYTTANEPRVSQWPYTIYDKPLFHMPPLISYIMKIGGIFKLTTQAAMLFSNLVILIFLLHLYLFLKRIKIPENLILLTTFFVVIDPVFVFSTTRIHHDTTCGMLMASSLIALVFALEKRSLLLALWSGLLISIGLNLRMTALIVLPVFFIFQFVFLYQTKSTTTEQSFFKKWRYAFAIALIILIFGLQHYYRLFLEYGTVMPGSLSAPRDPNNSWVIWAAEQSTLDNSIQLFLMIPVLLILLFPKTWLDLFKSFKDDYWPALFAIAFLIVYIQLAIFSHHEVRFFSAATPLFYCFFPWLITKYKAEHLPVLKGLAAICIFLMITAAYRETIIRPQMAYDLQPVICEYIPFCKGLFN